MSTDDFGIDVEIDYDFDPDQSLFVGPFLVEDNPNHHIPSCMSSPFVSLESNLANLDNSSDDLGFDSLESIVVDSFDDVISTDSQTSFLTETLDLSNSTVTVGSPMALSSSEFFADADNSVELPPSDYDFAAFADPVIVDQGFLTETLGMYNSSELPPPSQNYYQSLLMNQDKVQLPLGPSFTTHNHPLGPTEQTLAAANDIITGQFSPAYYRTTSNAYSQLGPGEYYPQLNYLRSSGSNFANSVFHLMSYDPYGVAFFLAGKVRPGPGVDHIYRCPACQAEFPDPRAFGGHMKMHGRKKEPVSVKSKSLKVKASGSSSSSSKKAK